MRSKAEVVVVVVREEADSTTMVMGLVFMARKQGGGGGGSGRVNLVLAGTDLGRRLRGPGPPPRPKKIFFSK